MATVLMWDSIPGKKLFDIYLIKNQLIYSHKVNSAQTFKDQQLQKRRPRFSIFKELILKNNIKPVKTGNLNLS